MLYVESIKSVMWAKYATFDGRARRSEIWWFYLTYIVGWFAVLVGGGALANGQETSSFTLYPLIPAIYWLACLVPQLAVIVRRLHDTGRSGLWWFIVLVPGLGSVILIVFLCQPGTQGPNEYGPDPLGDREVPASVG